MNLFDNIMNLFDKLYAERGKNLPGFWHWPNFVESYCLKKLLKKYKIKGLILDAGCGVGLKLEVLKGYRVVGFDISIEGLKVAKESNFPLVRASIHILPFKDKSFDLVYSFQVLQHLPTWDLIEISFSEISRILKIGGIFITSNYRLGGMLKERYKPVMDGENVVLPRWAFRIEDYKILGEKNSMKLIKCGSILNFKPRLVGRIPSIKPLWASLDYLMFQSGIQKGLYLFGVFKKIG